MIKGFRIILVSGLLFIFLAASGAASDALQEEARYQADNGIEVISYTDKWVDLGLIRVYDELMNNVHGMEMDYLDRIEIHAGSSPETAHNVMATYQIEKQEEHIGVNLKGFFPDDYELPIKLDKGVIRIYKGEERQAIEDIAVDLSHEYGHHFTLYHFGETFTRPEYFRTSEYYNIRGLEDYPLVNAEASHELEMHRWSIYELAAEDYRQILGSDTGRRITGFKDIKQKKGQDLYLPINEVSIRDYNAIGQMNWDLPTAFHNSVLVDYFYAFTHKGDVYKRSLPLMADQADELPGLDYSISPLGDYYQTKFYWDRSTGPEDAIYTLVAYRDDKVIPIKTVFPGQDPLAYIGTVYYEEDGYIYYYQDGLDSGQLSFRLQVLLPDGRNLSGHMISIDFDQEVADLLDGIGDTG
ncbi:MAG TPA: hypothetical protein VFD33_00260 [Bacillota bacterium]|nr:hypothetical protein [Bacillota bacterium]